MTSRLISPALIFALALSGAPAFAQVAGTPNSPPPTNAAATPPASPAPASAPAPTPAPADTNAPASTTPEERPSTYAMEPGDSLDSIAKKFDTSIHALAKLNKIPKSKYRKLRAGTVLKIPPAKTDSATK